MPRASDAAPDDAATPNALREIVPHTPPPSLPVFPIPTPVSKPQSGPAWEVLPQTQQWMPRGIASDHDNDPPPFDPWPYAPHAVELLALVALLIFARRRVAWLFNHGKRLSLQYLRFAYRWLRMDDVPKI